MDEQAEGKSEEQESQQSDIITPEEIREIDRLYYSPEERAIGVNSILIPYLEDIQKDNDGKPTAWDILIWCSQYMAQMSIVMDHPGLLENVKALSNTIYRLHYSGPQILYGKPDKRSNAN